MSVEMVETLIFGIGSLMGLVASGIMLIREVRAERLLKKSGINGVKELMARSSVSLHLLLCTVQLINCSLAIAGLLIPPPRPAVVGHAIVFGLILGTWLLGILSVHLYRSRIRVEEEMDNELEERIRHGLETGKISNDPTGSS